MAKKFNPAQLELEFFPVSAVAKINEAHIREFKRVYWEHSTENSAIRDMMSDAFVERLAMDTATAKQELRQMMRRSRYWNERLQAWAIPIQHSIPVDRGFVLQTIKQMWETSSMSGETWTNALIAMEYFLPNVENKAYAVEAVERITGKRLNTGMKKTKVFMKVSKALGVYSSKRSSTYQKLESQLFTAWEPCVIKDTLYVSINPAHFLSMSNPKGDSRGEMLTSCHSFNGSFLYKSGCIGYARDEVSIVAFTASAVFDDDSLLNRKTSRQLFFYKDGALIQSRLYTSRTGKLNSGYGGVNSADEHWEYGVFRATIKKEIARCEGVPKIGWKNADYRRKIHCVDGNPDNVRALKINRFCVEAWGAEEFDGYPDWEEFARGNGMIKVSVRQDRLNDDGEWDVSRQGMDIGAAGLSLKTGTELYKGRSITA